MELPLQWEAQNDARRSIEGYLSFEYEAAILQEDLMTMKAKQLMDATGFAGCLDNITGSIAGIYKRALEKGTNKQAQSAAFWDEFSDLLIRMIEDPVGGLMTLWVPLRERIRRKETVRPEELHRWQPLLNRYPQFQVDTGPATGFVPYNHPAPRRPRADRTSTERRVVTLQDGSRVTRPGERLRNDNNQEMFVCAVGATTLRTPRESAVRKADLPCEHHAALYYNSRKNQGASEPRTLAECMRAVHMLRFCFDARNPEIEGSELCADADRIRDAPEAERRNLWTAVKAKADQLERASGTSRISAVRELMQFDDTELCDMDECAPCFLVLEMGHTEAPGGAGYGSGSGI
tara:strand:+ start:193 stop:1236 length:1044 start_codon:yes stop_codon:yes gene_type:complete